MQGGCGSRPTASDADRQGVRPAAVAAVDAALHAAGLDPHRPAPGEWGVALPCAGRPLHVGIAVRAGLVEARAEVLGSAAADPAWLLHRNRRALRVVRYATSAAGDVWVHGDLPAAGLTAAAVDELLGRLVEAADAARSYASSPSAAIVRSR